MSRNRTAFLALLAILATVLASGWSLGKKLVPERGPAPVPVEISGRVYTYFPLTSDRPLVVRLDGPVVFKAIARWRFTDSVEPVDLEIEFTIDGSEKWRHIIRAQPGTAAYPDGEGTAAGRAGKFSFDVPSGAHVVEIRLVAPADGVLDVNLLSEFPSVLPWRLAWRGEMGVSYDSNIFRYSDADVDDYLDGEREDRFPIEGVDDARLEPSVDVALAREEPGFRTTEIRLSADWRLACVNGEKSFGKFAVRVREEREGMAYLTTAYSAIPKYYIRDLWDADTREYRACDFLKHAVRLELGSHRSLPVDVAGIGKYEIYNYDPDFVEYDSTAWSIGVRATVRPLRGLRLDLKYALRSLTARGYDEVGETRATSDDSDTSYDQDEYELRARWEAGRWWGFPAVVSFRGRYAKRFYLAEKSGEDDPYHAGREDGYWTVRAQVALRLTESSGLELFFEHRVRNAESQFVPDIGDVKDYTANRVGLRLFTEGVRFLD